MQFPLAMVKQHVFIRVRTLEGNKAWDAFSNQLKMVRLYDNVL